MAEETNEAISAAKPPVLNPITSATAVHAATLKLKPVIRKPVAGASALPKTGLKLPSPAKPVAPAAAPAASPAAAPAMSPAETAKIEAMDQLKQMTQKLKGVTQQLPSQAILHRTGIIADAAMTEAQKQASKSRTARISLSDAIGAAPVKEEAKPMKTIRIKRPVDIPSGSPAPAAAKPVVAPVVETEKPAGTEEAAVVKPAAAPATTVTQKKTLKISRPGVGGARPAPKFGVKKPGGVPAAPATGDKHAAPAGEGGDGAVADIPEIADIPDMPAAVPAAGGTVSDVPLGVAIVSIAVQLAACVAMGLLAWQLYQDYMLPIFVGGCQ